MNNSRVKKARQAIAQQVAEENRMIEEALMAQVKIPFWYLVLGMVGIKGPAQHSADRQVALLYPIIKNAKAVNAKSLQREELN